MNTLRYAASPSVVVILFLLTATGCTGEAPKLHEQKVIELLDGLCLQNSREFSAIDDVVIALGGTLIQSGANGLDPVIARMGGKSYRLTYENADFFVGYSENGGCSVATKTLNHNAVQRILQQNYNLKLGGTLDEGMQTQKTFFFTADSSYSGGAIALVFPKKSTRNTSGSIAYIPAKAVAAATERQSELSSENAATCLLSEKKKTALRQALCQGSDGFATTTGPRCQEKMLQKQRNMTAVQIAEAEKCGFKKHANQLREISAESMRYTRLIYKCLDLNVDIDKVVAIANDYEREIRLGLQACSEKQRITWAQRLPHLVQEERSAIEQAKQILKVLGIN